MTQVSFKLIPAAGNNEVTLTVFSGPNCGLPSVSLGTSFYSDTEGLCSIGYENAFSLQANPGVNYQVSWRAKKNPNSAEAKAIGAIVGGVIGALLLIIIIGAAVGRMRMRAMMNKNLSSGQSTVVVQQQQPFQMQRDQIAVYGGPGGVPAGWAPTGAMRPSPPPPPVGAPQYAQAGGHLTYPPPPPSLPHPAM